MKKSHGPKNVISMLHNYLCNFSLGEKKVVFHADNCGEQNESKTVHYITSHGKWERDYTRKLSLSGARPHLMYL